MSEAELLEIANANFGNGVSIMALFLSLLSGYLIVAYIVGSKMTRSQVMIVNTLYIGLGAFLILSMIAFSTNANEQMEIAFEMTTQRSIEPNPYLAHIVTSFLAFCLAASLKFMWDIRHPKTDQP